jgi:hypothetical protein
VQAETISAFVASGAAVLGVPAALVVGLRQARAARQAAEVAAASAREQWKKSHVREAAIAFVGHAEQALGHAARLATARGLVDLSELTAAREALWLAEATVRTEGPAHLADLANQAHQVVDEFVIPVLGEQAERRPRLMRQQDFVVVGIDKTVETIENATEEGSGRVHGLARDIDPVRLTDLGSHLLKLVQLVIRQDGA